MVCSPRRIFSVPAVQRLHISSALMSVCRINNDSRRRVPLDVVLYQISGERREMRCCGIVRHILKEVYASV